MEDSTKISIATHLKGEFVTQIVCTTPCKTIRFKGIAVNAFLLLTILKAESKEHFNLFQNTVNNELVIEKSR